MIARFGECMLYIQPTQLFLDGLLLKHFLFNCINVIGNVAVKVTHEAVYEIFLFLPDWQLCM